MTIAYCLRCKEKREMKDEKEVTTKNNRRMLKGICAVCGTTVCKFLGKSK